jgi:hypothetical protein
LQVKELEEQLNIAAKSQVKISSITLLWCLWKCWINTIKVSDYEWIYVTWIFQKLLLCGRYMLWTQQVNWNNIWRSLYIHRASLYNWLFLPTNAPRQVCHCFFIERVPQYAFRQLYCHHHVVFLSEMLHRPILKLCHNSESIFVITTS